MIKMEIASSAYSLINSLLDFFKIMVIFLIPEILTVPIKDLTILYVFVNLNWLMFSQTLNLIDALNHKVKTIIFAVDSQENLINIGANDSFLMWFSSLTWFYI